ncbi:unnamed protein product [Paramecium pentaurelia]|uniref:Transmembrane protein n=1 Tax=Paramecium pentaurelia TaxID=43138 RepID=A0A8S1TU13_9CILI|nr:unnamed protein product [Paramecium pentaurelia]
MIQRIVSNPSKMKETLLENQFKEQKVMIIHLNFIFLKLISSFACLRQRNCAIYQTYFQVEHYLFNGSSPSSICLRDFQHFQFLRRNDNSPDFQKTISRDKAYQRSIFSQIEIQKKQNMIF